VANLGPGLAFVNGRIQVRLSRDAGNITVFGSDQGIYTPGGTIPPDEGRKTVEGLPDQVFAGMFGGAGLLHAYASPAAIEYAVANRIDVIDNMSWASTDDVAVWSPAPPSGTAASTGFYTLNLSNASIRFLDSEQWVQQVSDAGTPDGNPTGRNSGAPAAFLTPDGGWYGFNQAHYNLMTTAQALKQIGARAVVFLIQMNDGDMDVDANINAILGLNAQDWVVPFVNAASLDTVTRFLDTSIPHVGVNVADDTTVTAGEIVSSGATWVRINHTQGVGRIGEFVTAGLQVVPITNCRQTVTTGMFAAGVRGITCPDPVYARGALGDEWREYRRGSITFAFRTTETGMLTPDTDTGAILSARGYAKQAEFGRYFQQRAMWNGNVARELPNQLLGKFNPSVNVDEYTMTMAVQLDQTTLPSGSFQYQGWLFANDNDLDPSHPISTTPPATRHGYLAYIGVGTSNAGRLVIGKFSATGVFTQLAQSATTRPVTPNSWVNLQLQVNADEITLTRTDGAPAYSVTVTDTDWRGPYFYYVWRDASTLSQTPFQHGYRDNFFNPGTTSAVVWDQLTLQYANWTEFATAATTWGAAETSQPAGSAAGE
jgi:hypothetical protein